MRYVHVRLAGDWVTFWRQRPGETAEKVIEDHEVDVEDLIELVDQEDEPPALEHHDRTGFPLERGRLPRGITLMELLDWSPEPERCAADGCDDAATVRYEIDRDATRGWALNRELRCPAYCETHAAAAESNPVMKLIGPL